MDYSAYKQIEFRRKFFKFFGASITASDAASNQPLLFIALKAFRWKEEIHIYHDQAQQQELMQIKAQQVVALTGRTFDIIDPAKGQAWMSLRRKAFKSTFVRDHWDLLDTSGNVFGSIEETSPGIALARRWIEVLPFGEIVGLVLAFTAQTYEVNILQASGPVRVAHITHRKNPFVVKMLLDTSVAQMQVDPRIAVAATSMLAINDASKNS